MYEVLYLCHYRPIWRLYQEAWDLEEALSLAAALESSGRRARVQDELGRVVYQS